MNMDTIILLRTHMCKKYEKNSDRIQKDKKYKKGTYELCTQKIQKRKLKTCHYRNE